MQYYHFRGFIEVKLFQKLSMSPNEEVFKFLKILFLYVCMCVCVCVCVGVSMCMGVCVCGCVCSYEMRVCFPILLCIISASYHNSFLLV